MTEEWLPINGFPGYEVSNLGRVGCWRKRGSRHPFPSERRIVTPVKNKTGYLQVTLHQGREKFTRNIHRLVLETFVGPCPDGMECAHGDGNRQNPVLSNLRWDTRKNNHADKIRHGTAQRGENQWFAKVTEAQVREIRKSTESNAAIAIRYGLAKEHVWSLRNRKSWAWLDDAVSE